VYYEPAEKRAHKTIIERFVSSIVWVDASKPADGQDIDCSLSTL
jgi:hypothetical protein